MFGNDGLFGAEGSRHEQNFGYGGTGAGFFGNGFNMLG